MERQDKGLRLDNCLKGLSDKGLRLNHAKCSFVNETIEFFGQILSKEGSEPDPKRVDALKNASSTKEHLGSTKSPWNGEL